MLEELQIDQGLVQAGVPLSLEETYERYGRTPPKGPDDRFSPPAGQPPGGGPGGPPGAPASPFVDDAVNVLTVPPQRTLLAPGGGRGVKDFRGYSERWQAYLAG
jgi:hypothetical protein